MPRIFTRELRDLSDPAHTEGHAFLAFCRDELAWNPMPWMEELALRGLELNEQGQYQHSVICALAGRQSGKSTLSAALSLYKIIKKDVRLVLGAAQNLSVSLEILERAVEMCEDADIRHQYLKSNGKEQLIIGRGKYKIVAASRRARGKSTGHLTLDEVREQQDESAWAALSPMTAAIPNAQTWAISNAGDRRSVLLARFISQGRTAAAQEDYEGNFCFLEWSGQEGCELDDRTQWAQAIPSLNITITEAFIASALATMAPDDFRAEYLCQTVINLRGAIDTTAWQSCADAAGSLQEARGRIAAAVDTSPDGHTSLCAAAQGRDGTVRLELVAAWASVAEARRELPAILEKVAPRRLGYFGSSPSVALAEDLRRAVGSRLVRLSDPSEACGAFGSLVDGRRLRHGGQRLLDEHIASATRMPRGAGWIFARSGAEPISAAYAASAAVLIARQFPAPSSARLIIAAA